MFVPIGNVLQKVRLFEAKNVYSRVSLEQLCVVVSVGALLLLNCLQSLAM